jgi:predicted adenylyl cyclase CyaB
MQEIEIKFAITDTKEIPARLRKLGFRLTVDRHQERNYLFDDGASNLQTAGKLLRVRHTPLKQTVTFKGPIRTSSKLKHREEIECGIENADIVIRILEEVGFRVRTEYSKYRTVFEKDDFNISLDETEAGNYLEVEGPSEQAIIDLATQLGYSEQDFVRRTYADLIGERRRVAGDNNRGGIMTNERDPSNDEPLENVAVAGPAEAEMIEEMLKSNGIDCSLQGNVPSSPFPTVSDLDEVRVLVRKSAAAKAQELVDGFFTPISRDELVEGESDLGVDESDEEPSGFKI